MPSNSTRVPGCDSASSVDSSMPVAPVPTMATGPAPSTCQSAASAVSADRANSATPGTSCGAVLPSA
ncbi:Uncharacterised protein [Mycobacteroides abscessus subsp. abscessus]|nr:Uncharacterised protein [Mycobacteroides abscessus subsp. abscessus]